MENGQIFRSESSIYADLRKFAGPIKAIKINNEPLTQDVPTVQTVPTVPTVPTNQPEQPVVKKRKTQSKQVKQPEVVNEELKKAIAPPATPQITIDDIAAMIKPPMFPLQDQNGFVHDVSAIAARCERGHIHKYFLKDIIADSGIKRCHTCSSGNKFMIMVRETAERVFGLPFILTESQMGNNTIEYTNPILKITFICARSPGEDTLTMVGDNALLKIHPTSSLKKIKDIICTQLSEHPTLSDEQKMRVIALKPVKTAKKKIYQKDPLPFTPALATLNSAGAENPLLAQMEMNVITSDPQQLCLENC